MQDLILLKSNQICPNLITFTQISHQFCPNFALKPGAVFFNAGCNDQVFSPKPSKKFDADPFYRFREKCKKRTINPENDVTEPKTRLL